MAWAPHFGFAEPFSTLAFLILFNKDFSFFKKSEIYWLNANTDSAPILGTSSMVTHFRVSLVVVMEPQSHVPSQTQKS
jgi:hypothetical protein